MRTTGKLLLHRRMRRRMKRMRVRRKSHSRMMMRRRWPRARRRWPSSSRGRSRPGRCDLPMPRVTGPCASLTYTRGRKHPLQQHLHVSFFSPFLLPSTRQAVSTYFLHMLHLFFLQDSPTRLPVRQSGALMSWCVRVLLVAVTVIAGRHWGSGDLQGAPSDGSPH